MLRLRNLPKLPSIPPTCAQLERLLRDELEPIRAFSDWAEAWAVYASVVGRSDPSKFPSLVTYFLTIAKAQLDVPGSGWRDYDIAFRKQVADNPSLSWSTMDPTLYLSTVLTSGAQYNPNRVRKNVVSQPQRNAMSYFNWNRGHFKFRGSCVYTHTCSTCNGQHTATKCPVGVNHGPSGANKRGRSPSPKPSKKHQR